MADIKGYLQVDGLSSYDQFGKQDGVVRLGCNMHARRCFEKAKTDGAKAGKRRTEEGLKFYKALYEIEEEIRDKTPEERSRERDERTRPILEERQNWAKKMKPKVPLKSKIGGTFNYF